MCKITEYYCKRLWKYFCHFFGNHDICLKKIPPGPKKAKSISISWTQESVLMSSQPPVLGPINNFNTKPPELPKVQPQSIPLKEYVRKKTRFSRSSKTNTQSKDVTNLSSTNEIKIPTINHPSAATSDPDPPAPMTMSDVVSLFSAMRSRSKIVISVNPPVTSVPAPSAVIYSAALRPPIITQPAIMSLSSTAPSAPATHPTQPPTMNSIRLPNISSIPMSIPITPPIMSIIKSNSIQIPIITSNQLKIASSTQKIDYTKDHIKDEVNHTIDSTKDKVNHTINEIDSDSDEIDSDVDEAEELDSARSSYRQLNPIMPVFNSSQPSSKHIITPKSSHCDINPLQHGVPEYLGFCLDLSKFSGPAQRSMLVNENPPIIKNIDVHVLNTYNGKNDSDEKTINNSDNQTTLDITNLTLPDLSKIDLKTQVNNESNIIYNLNISIPKVYKALDEPKIINEINSDVVKDKSTEMKMTACDNYLDEYGIDYFCSHSEEIYINLIRDGEFNFSYFNSLATNYDIWIFQKHNEYLITRKLLYELYTKWFDYNMETRMSSDVCRHTKIMQVKTPNMLYKYIKKINNSNIQARRYTIQGKKDAVRLYTLPDIYKYKYNYI